MFSLFQLRPLPGIAGNHSYCQSIHSGRAEPDDNDFENISTLFFEIPKRIHSSTIILKTSRAFGNHIEFFIIRSSGPAGKRTRKAFPVRYRTSKSRYIQNKPLFLFGLAVDQAIDRPIDRPIERPSCRCSKRPGDRAIERPSDRCSERSSDRAIQRPSDGTSRQTAPATSRQAAPATSR